MATSVSSTGSDEDRTRFCKLSLIIIDELTQILRDLLHNEVPSTRIFQKVIKVNHLTKTLRTDQIAIIRDANIRAYQDFDITLLYALLRNVCQNITPPSQNWGVSIMPSPNEVTVGDDIERIRLIRNKLFGHISEAAISETEFKEHWSIIYGICSRIKPLLNKDYVERLQDVEERSIDSDTEEKCLQLIKRQAEEEKTIRDLLHANRYMLQNLTENFTSKETIEIEPNGSEKRHKVNTFTHGWISVLNEAVAAINDMTSESDIRQIYEAILQFTRGTKEEHESLLLQNLVQKLQEKIHWYAKLKDLGVNRIRILLKFAEFYSSLVKEYGILAVKCSEGSIILLVTFSSRNGYDLYQKDLENGRIGEQILEMFLYPPFIERFDLKADDIEISLNGSLLTLQTGSLRSLESVETLDPQYIPVCDLCETPAPSVHCHFCHIDLCDACVGNHSSDEAKDHYIVPFELRSLATKYQAESLMDDPDIKIKSFQDSIKTLSISTLSTDKVYDDRDSTTEKFDSLGKNLLGAMSTTPAKSFIYDPRILTEINTVYRYMSLRRVSCLSDNELWTSGRDKTLKLYNLQGELLKSLQTKSGYMPHDIAVTRGGGLVYSDRGNSSINLVSGTQIQTLITLRGWGHIGLCSTSSGALLVIMTSDDRKQTKVVRYSGSIEKQSIQWDDQGMPLYSSGNYNDTKYLSENRNSDICVADWSARAVVVVSAAGKLRFRYTGPSSTPWESFRPLGITTDSQANILTSDHYNHRIHIIDQDGLFLRYIDRCDLHCPYGLCVDSRDNLFVAEHLTCKVKQIQYYK
uniref:Uncharacterized protein LOC111122013 n=1 Tax=Crassostrea virginica TaxID=6565 RepID=A0A8B8CTV0_CRAVI|nr:uncharacterized protein LOC111122013 [Crassostrea virginica]